MPRIDGLLQLLHGRAFGSVWYWLLLAVVWSIALRGILGIPSDVVGRAVRVDPDGPDDPAALMKRRFRIDLPGLRRALAAGEGGGPA